MANMMMPEEAQRAIVEALKGWAASGVPRPAIPIYADMVGDPRPDYYALDTFGRLVIVDAADVSGYDLVENLDQPEEGP